MVGKVRSEEGAPRAGFTARWATPPMEKGVKHRIRAAAPRVESTVERVIPMVDTARDRIVKDALPRLVDVVNTAARAGAAAGVTATKILGEATDDGARLAKAGLQSAATRAAHAGRVAPEEQEGQTRPTPKAKAHRWCTAGLILAGAGAAAGGAFWLWWRARAERHWREQASALSPADFDAGTPEPEPASQAALPPDGDERAPGSGGEPANSTYRQSDQGHDR